MAHSFKKEILIIGGGFAGLSTAYFLAKKGVHDIAIIERERKLGGHASGRNAGMVRQAVSDPLLASLAIEGQHAFRKAKNQGWPFAFKTQGSLLLASGSKVRELYKIQEILKNKGVSSKILSQKEASKKVSILKDGNFECALFCASDSLVDIEALLKSFLKQLREFRVKIFLGRTLHSIQKTEDGYLVKAGSDTFNCKKIVNAAGAWAGAVGEKAGGTLVPFKAYRRHLFESAPSKSYHKAWPFVWDLSHKFYFRPLNRGLLLSPCDKKAFKLKLEKAHVPGEVIDSQVQSKLFKKLKKFSPELHRLKIKKAKAGLRTMTPDGRFVIGEDAKRKGFYWVAGLGGHGLTTCFSVGRLAADLIIGKKSDINLVKSLSPSRFKN